MECHAPIPRFPRCRIIWLLFLLSFFSTSVQTARAFSRVVIDPGHGGKDPGAYWGGIKEKDVALKIAQRVENILQQKGIKTAMTRRSDTFISLKKRAQISNQYSDAIFISIHCNAHTNTSIRGIETFYFSSKGYRLATSIQSALMRKIKTRNRGCKKKGFTVLTSTRCTAVLVECGFLSNAWERKRCAAAWYQEIVAQAIVEGILKFRS